MKKALAILAAAALGACSTMRNRDAHARLIKNVEAGDFAAAAKEAESDGFYPEERSALLLHMERGSAYYYAGMNRRALLEFDKAKKISDDLYTRRISAAAKSALDSNQSEFTGERFERSQIRFFQSLLHYKLYQGGKYEAWEDESGKYAEKNLSDAERRSHLNSAKSVLSEWNSLLSQYKMETGGKPEYKADISENLWGAFVNASTGNANDRQIAIGLYRQAKEALFKYYNIYPSFNAKHEEFAKDFASLGAMQEAEVEKKYTAPTAESTALGHLIDAKLAALNKGERDNVAVIVEDGLIAEKKADEHKLDFSPQTIFIMSRVALIAGGRDAYFRTFAATYLLNDITYDLPYINPKAAPKIEAKIIDSAGAETDLPLTISSPLSDMAARDIGGKIAGEKAVLITRLTSEYILAAWSAYKTYKEVLRKNNSSMGELLATASAIASFKGLGAAINESNRADIRQWKLLPSNIRFGSAKLKPGEYTLKISVSGGASREHKFTLGDGPALIDVKI
jgi:hypothetical protein